MTASPDFVIAVDGPAASGKGTIAAKLGRAFGLPVLDTGLLYRAVGIATTDLTDEMACSRAAQGLDLSRLEDPSLRTAAAGEAASRVAVWPDVRRALYDFQRHFAGQPGGAVLDGRDMGTVIAPDAPAKLFVTASPEVRAGRRWRQLADSGEDVPLSAVLEDIRARDARDCGRDAAPLVQAQDAVLLDTTDLDIEAAFDVARRIVETARARWELSHG